MTDQEIAQARLVNQQIVQAQARSPGEVVAALGAMQAQDYNAALWAVGVRLPGSTEAVIEQAIADGSIIRTWPLRGTLHFVAAADARWMVNLLGPQIAAGSLRRRQQLDLDDAALARSREVLVEGLQDGQPRTREDLLALLETSGIATGGQRGYHILWQQALAGVICCGPRQGKQQTFVLLDKWAPNARQLDRAEALGELAVRYFSGHGPATLQDFVWWSGLRVGDARIGIELAAPQLAQAEVDGVTYWMAQTTPMAQASAAHTVFLPGFDEYMLGYRQRGAVLDPQHAQKIVPGSNGIFRPILVMDGRIVGTWKRTIKRNKVIIEVSPFEPLDAAQAHTLSPAADQYGAFIGREVELVD